MRLVHAFVASVLVALVSCSPATVAARPAASGPLVLRFDAAEARAQGWVAADASEEQVRERLSAFVRWRLAAAGVEHELVPTPTGVEVRTPERERVRAAARGILEALGACEFYLRAEEHDVPGGLAAESARFEAWRTQHPARPLLDYNVDPARPAPGIAWLPTLYGESEGPPFPVLLPREATDAFSSRDFEKVFVTTGNLDYPAIGLKLFEERVDDFANFTGAAVKRQLAITFGSCVRSAPTLASRLLGNAIIEGRFTDAEVKDLIARVQSGGGAPVMLVE